MTRLAIDMIRRDGGTQMRVAINDEAAVAYAERMEAGDTFPPVVVFYDGETHWLADGFHRINAIRKNSSRTLGTPEHAKWQDVESDIQAGSRDDAILHAISANRTNGLRRTNADKQVAVRAALAHPSMQTRSDQAIADEVGVSREMVQKTRPQVGNLPTSTQPPASPAKSEPRTRTARTGVDGKTYRATPPKSDLKATANTKNPKRTPEEKRESERVRMAALRSKKTNKPAPKRVCPMCGGKGHLNE